METPPLSPARGHEIVSPKPAASPQKALFVPSPPAPVRGPPLSFSTAVDDAQMREIMFRRARIPLAVAKPPRKPPKRRRKKY
jgi:hypothetical protein